MSDGARSLSSPARTSLTFGAAFLCGAVLFFLCFAAIFNGSWVLLLLFLLGYALAGALGTWAGDVPPRMLAIVLSGPAAPWVLWLFPASIPEAGLARALLWPGLVVLGGILGWLGGYAIEWAPGRLRKRVLPDRACSRQAEVAHGRKERTTLPVRSPCSDQSLKVVVPMDPVVAAATKATALESGALTRRDRDRCGRASRSALCRHAPGGTRV
jgi:hypothetical protein